jgi:hypothetical protein
MRLHSLKYEKRKKTILNSKWRQNPSRGSSQNAATQRVRRTNNVAAIFLPSLRTSNPSKRHLLL